MFKQHLVDKSLVNKATELFRIIFPNETMYDEETGSLDNCFALAAEETHEPPDIWRYYLYTDSTPDCPYGKYIGMSGIYVEKSDPESAWLGWLGVLPEYRRERYGTRMLNYFEREAKELGFKFARLYTNEGNLAARALYEFAGYTMERLNYDPPEYVKVGGEVVIYSRSLYKDVPLVPWNSRPLEF